jgi:hypothetical protein
MDAGQALKQELLMSNGPSLQVPYAQPLLDAVSLFDELGIGYALIGGIASMYYGRARFTEDVDFVVGAGHMERFSANLQVMERFHFSPDCVCKLYHQSGISVDIWKDEFADQIVQRSLSVPLAGRMVQIIEPHDLIAMKLRAGRLKDDYDIAQILASTPIDEQRFAGLLSPEQIDRLNQIKTRS